MPIKITNSNNTMGKIPGPTRATATAPAKALIEKVRMPAK
jgi:hypothetical protein